MWTLILVLMVGSSLQGTTAVVVPTRYATQELCEKAFSQMSTNAGSGIKQTAYYCVPSDSQVK